MPLTQAERDKAYRARQAQLRVRAARMEAALRRIAAHDDPELTNEDLSQHDRQGGWDAAFRLAGDIARAALQED